jgi:hypothetical protein
LAHMALLCRCAIKQIYNKSTECRLSDARRKLAEHRIGVMHPVNCMHDVDVLPNRELKRSNAAMSNQFYCIVLYQAGPENLKFNSDRDVEVQGI